MMHKLKEYMDVIKGDKEKEQEVYEYLWWGICKLKQHDATPMGLFTHLNRCK
jgi:hypothetical protein